MKRMIHYQINANNDNKTIGQFLKEQGYSHPVIVGLKKTYGGILLNNTWAYVTEHIKEHDILTICIEEPPASSNIIPVPLPLNIIYEDTDLMIIDKPANMPIHPSMENYDNTLANAVSYYFNSLGEPITFRCINRLDRDTTGLTIIAKHTLSAAILNRQAANREIHRTYLAICQGNLPMEGTIDAPIDRVCDSVIARCINFETGKPAITHYQKLDYRNDLDLSFVRLYLETGRTHQIRVHLKYIGHPLIGDFLYNPVMDNMKRQALHADSLTFIHPITKEKMHFHAPLPWDMKCIFPAH